MLNGVNTKLRNISTISASFSILPAPATPAAATEAAEAFAAEPGTGAADDPGTFDILDFASPFAFSDGDGDGQPSDAPWSPFWDPDAAQGADSFYLL